MMEVEPHTHLSKASQKAFVLTTPLQARSYDTIKYIFFSTFLHGYTLTWERFVKEENISCSVWRIS